MFSLLMLVLNFVRWLILAGNFDIWEVRGLDVSIFFTSDLIPSEFSPLDLILEVISLDLSSLCWLDLFPAS